MFGDSPQAIDHSFTNTRFPAVEDKMKRLIKDWEEALAAHELARTQMIDRRKGNFTPFCKGDKVWLDSRNLQTLYHKKMAPKREGPFEIMEVIGPVTYWLKLLTTWKVHNVFHASLLWQYKEIEVYGANFDWPQLNSLAKKKSTRSKLSWNIENGDEGTNTLSSGKVERIPDHWGIVGTWRDIYRRGELAWSVQALTSTMNRESHKTVTCPSLHDCLEELDWHFQDIFDQFRNVYGLLDDINCLIASYPLEFLLFEIQQTVSFLRRH